MVKLPSVGALILISVVLMFVGIIGWFCVVALWRVARGKRKGDKVMNSEEYNVPHFVVDFKNQNKPVNIEKTITCNCGMVFKATGANAYIEAIFLGHQETMERLGLFSGKCFEKI